MLSFVLVQLRALPRSERDGWEQISIWSIGGWEMRYSFTKGSDGPILLLWHICRTVGSRTAKAAADPPDSLDDCVDPQSGDIDVRLFADDVM